MDNFTAILKTIILLIFIYLAYLLIQPFLGMVIVAIVFAIIFSPVHRFFQKKLSPGLSAFLTVFLSTILIIFPLLGVIPLLAKEAVTFGQHLDVNGIWNFLQGFKEIDLFGYKFPLNIDPSKLVDLSSMAGTYIASWSGTLVIMVSDSIGIFLMFIVLYYYFLKDGAVLFKGLQKVLPYTQKEQLILSRSFKQVAETVFMGNFLTALISGMMAYVAGLIFGLPSPLIWGLLAMILSFIPTAGAFLLYLFGAVVSFFLSGWWMSLGLMIYFILMEVLLRENFIKPKLLDDKLSFHPVFIFFALVGGVSVFGPLGLFYGPIILTFVASLYDFHVKKER